MSPINLTRSGAPEVSKTTYVTSEPWVFSGGDVAGVAETTAEAVNDGKVAAWNMHNYLQSLRGKIVEDVPKLPEFFTPIDEVCVVTTCKARLFSTKLVTFNFNF